MKLHYMPKKTDPYCIFSTATNLSRYQ